MKTILLFIIGTIFGSFFGLVIDRLDSGESIVLGRSHCNLCHHILSVWELIPLLSQLLCRSRCRHCQAKIPLTYFFLELTSGLCFWAFFTSALDLAQFITLLACLVLSIFDYRQHAFPLVIWFFFALALCFFFPLRPLNFIWLILAGIAELKDIKIGSGDFLWLALASFSLPLLPLVWVLQIASLLGLGFFLIKKPQEIAFIPFLSIAYLMILIWGRSH